MKFDALTSEELCNLSDEQLSEYVDSELAALGKPLMPPALEKPESQVCEPDLEVYVLDRFNDLAVDKETADAIMKVLESAFLQRLNYKNKLETVNLKESYSAPEVKVLRLESNELKAKLATARQFLKMQWDEYNEREEERQVAEDARQEIVDDFISKIAIARQEVLHKQRLLAEWDRYLKLADGDSATAKKFFIDRYSIESYDKLKFWKEKDGKNEAR